MIRAIIQEGRDRLEILYVWDIRERHIRILLEKFKERDHLGDLDVEEKSSTEIDHKDVGCESVI
jgi:hypothetical protein